MDEGPSRRGVRPLPRREARPPVRDQPQPQGAARRHPHDSRWDVTYLGMQIMVEGLALAAFGFMRQATNEPLLQDLLPLRDERRARHVAFGVCRCRSTTAVSHPTSCVNDRSSPSTPRCDSRSASGTSGVGADGGRQPGGVGLPRHPQLRAADVFQTMLFSKIVPNCKKLGLLGGGRVAPTASPDRRHPVRGLGRHRRGVRGARRVAGPGRLTGSAGRHFWGRRPRCVAEHPNFWGGSAAGGDVVLHLARPSSRLGEPRLDHVADADDADQLTVDHHRQVPAAVSVMRRASCCRSSSGWQVTTSVIITASDRFVDEGLAALLVTVDDLAFGDDPSMWTPSVDTPERPPRSRSSFRGLGDRCVPGAVVATVEPFFIEGSRTLA